MREKKKCNYILFVVWWRRVLLSQWRPPPDGWFHPSLLPANCFCQPLDLLYGNIRNFLLISPGCPGFLLLNFIYWIIFYQKHLMDRDQMYSFFYEPVHAIIWIVFGFLTAWVQFFHHYELDFGCMECTKCISTFLFHLLESLKIKF